MIDKTRIEKLVRDFIGKGDIFLVDIKVTTGNKITVLVNKKGGITIDECVKLSKHIENSLDRETEDFELSVSSPGIGEPLLVNEQYEISVGHRVVVVDGDGEKHTGIMKSYSDGSFNLEMKQKVKGKKRELVEKPFNINEIRTVKVLITFKQ